MTALSFFLSKYPPSLLFVMTLDGILFMGCSIVAATEGWQIFIVYASAAVRLFVAVDVTTPWRSPRAAWGNPRTPVTNIGLPDRQRPVRSASRWFTPWDSRRGLIYRFAGDDCVKTRRHYCG